MQFIKLSQQLLFVLILMQIAPVVVRAEEGSGAKSEAEGGEKGAAEGGEKEKMGSGADREWAKRTTKINIYEAKIEDLSKRLKEMIHAKNSSKKALDEKGQPIDVIKSIAESHKELLQAVKDYAAEKAELKYRFPEEGVRIERRYLPYREQSLQELEHDMGLEGELTKTKLKIDKKYATFIDETVKPPPQKAELPESTIKEIKKPADEPKRLKLSE